MCKPFNKSLWSALIWKHTFLRDLFGTLESVYTFSSPSTHHWYVLTENVDISVERLSKTRWRAHHDGVKPSVIYFDKLVEAI